MEGKAGMKWMQEGDRNTKFFHSYVKKKEEKLHIGEIVTTQGEVLSKEEKIGEEAINCFGKQFQAEVYDEDFSIFNIILRLIS
ncbi:MAG: hypothetical protein Q8830_03005 [Candidatus Phytoplasma australasiaticum]|nr:hypothetical protein [Candidatus Phytoplasma australasiaticum]